MIIDIIPGWLLFLLLCGIVFVSVETGFRIGRSVRRKTEDERESPVSSIAGVIISLLAFMLAFTFGIVFDRYDTKKTLVREEANVMRTTWNRADFLPEAERTRSKALLSEYLERRIAVANGRDVEAMRASLDGFVDIQQQLWAIAVSNARNDMNSDIGALYVESINQLGELNATRFGIGVNTRIPTAIWITLLTLLILGMSSLGFQCAIALSRRSRVVPALAVSFSMVIVLIAALDHPGDKLMPVPQDALVRVLSEMKK
jgi:CDP-diglyceride synthetase